MRMTRHGNPEIERSLNLLALKNPKSRGSVIHAADTSYDQNGYGDSYVPLCTGPRANISSNRVSYVARQVTCKNCRKKL